MSKISVLDIDHKLNFKNIDDSIKTFEKLLGARQIIFQMRTFGKINLLLIKDQDTTNQHMMISGVNKEKRPANLTQEEQDFLKQHLVLKHNKPIFLI